MRVAIRKAAWEDHTAICKIAKQSKYTSAYSNMIFSGQDCYQSGRIWIATKGKTVLGFYCIRNRKRNPATVLYFTGVEEKFRGRGIGTQLLSHLHQLATNHVGVVELNVKKDNPAERLYRRLGYQTVGEAYEGTAYTLQKVCSANENAPVSG